MDDVQNLEQGLPNTNSSQIKQGRGKSNKNQQTRHFYGKWHRTSVSQNFSQESRFSNVISMWSAKTYHVWGWSLALASPWWFCALCCQIKKLCTGERVSTSLVEGKCDTEAVQLICLWIDSLAESNLASDRVTSLLTSRWSWPCATIEWKSGWNKARHMQGEQELFIL